MCIKRNECGRGVSTVILTQVIIDDSRVCKEKIPCFFYIKVNAQHITSHKGDKKNC